MLDQLFAACLLGGFALSVLMVLSAGKLGKARLHLLSRLHRPRFVPRLRLPGVRRPRVHSPAKSLVAGQGSTLTASAGETALFPPGTLPVFVALLATFFGAVGLLSLHSFHLSPLMSLLTAGIGGVLTTLVVAFAVWRYFLTGAAASELRSNVLLGTVGHVSVTIPEGGVGVIAYVAQGKRVTMPARSKSGQPLAQQTRVMIMDIAGHTAVVEEF